MRSEIFHDMHAGNSLAQGRLRKVFQRRLVHHSQHIQEARVGCELFNKNFVICLKVGWFQAMLSGWRKFRFATIKKMLLSRRGVI